MLIKDNKTSPYKLLIITWMSGMKQKALFPREKNSLSNHECEIN